MNQSECKYHLDKSSRKFICPSCGKKKFVKFVDASTLKYLPEKYGRCDREQNCGYFLSPYQDKFGSGFLSPGSVKSNYQYINTFKKEARFEAAKRSLSTIEPDLLKQSRGRYNENNFVQGLLLKFNPEIITKAIEMYHLGSSAKFHGSVIFWQIDKEGRIRTGKIMNYDPNSLKRVKSEQSSAIHWVHKYLNQDNYTLSQCLFGEHLLKVYPEKKVALVESEKTAIIGSIYFPQFIWLATGAKTEFKESKCQVLNGRKVILFPDLGAYGDWSKRAKELSHIANFTTSSLLEDKASQKDKEAGLDLADYLLRFDLEEFIKEDKPSQKSDRFPIEDNNKSDIQDEHRVDQPAIFAIDETKEERFALAYLDKHKRLYIPIYPYDLVFAVYKNIDDYNQRRKSIDYCKLTMRPNNWKKVKIKLSTCTIDPSGFIVNN